VKPIELAPAALAEAEQAAAWYAERDQRVGALFAEELDAALQRILDAPSRWPSYLHGTRRARLARFPYHVVYRDEPTRLLVIAIAHARRLPGYWSKR